MSKAKRVRAERAEREKREREQSWIDPRLRGAHAKHVPGARLSRVPYLVVVVSPVRLPDGKTIWFQTPQAAAFSLIEAKKLRDRGEVARVAALNDLEPRDQPNEWNPRNPSLVLDALANLTGAVLFSFAGLESLANEMLEDLPDEAVFVDRKGNELDRPGMVRWLTIEEKLREAIPYFTDVPVLDRGRDPWQSFKRLKDLRDDLVHAKERSYSTDADHPAVYGRLLLGHGSKCVEDAYGIARVIRPDFFPPHVREALEAL